MAAPVSLVGLGEEDLVDALIQMVECQRVDVTSIIDAYEDPTTMGAALNVVVRRLYGESKHVTNMLAAGKLGLAYCLRKAALEFDKDKIRELKKLGQIIAFNTAVNCWPGWADDGIVIEKAHISAGLGIAVKNRDLVKELALTPRELGGAHWLVGALELAAGEFKVARVAFEQAEQAFLTGDVTLAYALMARGYIALARKADPQCLRQGADLLNQALERLRGEGSKDAIFFADQLVTADRVLIAQIS